MREIYSYIFEQSKQGAKSVFDTILDLGDSLSTLPSRFPIEVIISNYDQEYRFIPKWSYKIIYTIHENKDQVIIARIFNTNQHPTRLVK